MGSRSVSGILYLAGGTVFWASETLSALEFPRLDLRFVPKGLWGKHPSP